MTTTEDQTAGQPDGSRPLRNQRHELFCQH